MATVPRFEVWLPYVYIVEAHLFLAHNVLCGVHFNRAQETTAYCRKTLGKLPLHNGINRPILARAQPPKLCLFSTLLDQNLAI